MLLEFILEKFNILKERLSLVFAVAFTVAIISSGLGADQAFAADIFIVPDSNQISKNQVIGATVYITSPNESINNAESIITFPSNILNVISIDRSNSIFSLWVEPPAFSNVQGTISFNGGLPNPGFSSNYGLLFRVTLKAVGVGSAPLAFSSASIRANDGLGTDVTNKKTGGTIDVTTANIIDVKVSPSSLPNEPIIYSSEAPVQTKWYSIKKATLAWTLGKDITAIQTSFGPLPDSTPNTTSIPPISQKQFSNLADGTWYFNARVKNEIGWSPIAHYQLNVDSTLPDSLDLSATTTNDYLIQIAFKAHDKTSGIATYDVYLDDNKVSSIEDTDEKILTHDLPLTIPGTHKVTIQAFDRAGNFIEKKVSLSLPNIGAQTQAFNMNLLYFVLIFIILIIIIIILGIIIGNMRYNALKRKANHDLNEIEKRMHSEFTNVHEDISKHVKNLKKAGKTRNLTEEESDILEHLSEMLSDIEKTLDKKLDDVKKDDL